MSVSGGATTTSAVQAPMGQSLEVRSVSVSTARVGLNYKVRGLRRDARHREVLIGSSCEPEKARPAPGSFVRCNTVPLVASQASGRVLKTP